MRFLRLIIVLALFVNNAHGQISHSLSIKRGDLYQKYFNGQNTLFEGQKRPLNIMSYYGRLAFRPTLNYRIQRRNVGLEVYHGQNGVCYYCFGAGFQYLKDQISNNQIMDAYSESIGITAFYSFFNKSYLQLDGGLGIAYIKYSQEEHLGFYAGSPWNEPALGGGMDKVLGPTANFNIKVPIWKGFFASTNCRGSYFPTGEFHKGHIIAEIGIGYTYTRRKKEVKQ